MLDGWREVELDQVFRQANVRVEGSIADPPVYSITKYAGVVPAEEYHSKRVASTSLSNYKVLRPGDWAYSTIHIDEGSIARNGLSRAGAVSPMYTTMHWTGAFDEPAYFELLLRTPAMLNRYKDAQQGTVNRRRSLPWKAFRALKVVVPDIQGQRRIVDLVNTVDETADAARSALQAMRTHRDALTRSAVRDGVTLRLDTLAEVSQGRSLPTAVQGVRSGEIPWFKIADMAQSPNVFGYRVAETSVSREELSQLGGRLLDPGSIVFPRVGAAVRTEKKRILDVAGAVDENHLVLTPRDGVPAEVLLAVVESLSLSSLVQDGAVPSLNMKLMRNTSVDWPVEAALPALADALGETREACRAQAAAAAALGELRFNLLSASLSGQHEIPDSYDELMEA